MPPKRLMTLLVIIAVVALALAWGLWPQAVRVETGEVSRRPLEVLVEEEGRTRVKDRYRLDAPVAGFLRRIELEAGDAVKQGEAVALIDPLPSPTLDPRARAEAEARVAAGRSALRRSEAAARQAREEAELAREEFHRRETLLAQRLVSRAEFDQARTRMRSAEAAAEAAQSAVEVARHELEAALAAQSFFANTPDDGGERDPAATVVLRAPVDGRVLRVLHESAGIVASGRVLLEVGDPRRLEVEVEVLSRDAVRIEPGGRVRFERWGGDRVLEGRVRTVEPTGFTKVSALGVEEQRVRVIADIGSPPEAWQKLGDGYRVEAGFIVWEDDDALTVPASALFRRDDGWAVFVVEDGRARLRPVETGPGSGLLTAVRQGLEAGETVIVHPGDEVEDGARVQSFRD